MMGSELANFIIRNKLFTERAEFYDSTTDRKFCYNGNIFTINDSSCAICLDSFIIKNFGDLWLDLSSFNTVEVYFSVQFEPNIDNILYEPLIIR